MTALSSKTENADLAVMLVWTIAVFRNVCGNNNLGRNKTNDSGD